MFRIRYIDNDAQREMINLRDRYALLREERARFERDFSARMSFELGGGGEYLSKRLPPSRGGVKTTLGPRSPETEQTLTIYNEKRDQSKARIKGLEQEIASRRRLIPARGAGRIPYAAAEVLRRLDRAGWLGSRLLVAGTNALYAYEAQAAVQIDEGIIATDDVDILNDARRKITFAAGGDDDDGQPAHHHKRGFIGALQKADKSFRAVSQNDFRAMNDAGFIVDLISPHDVAPTHPDAQRRAKKSRLSDHEDDLQPVAIEGLEWLVNAPRFEGISFDSRGWPVWIPTVDPRVFAAHKLWLSQRNDRDVQKRRRDREQAVAAAVIATEQLGLSFDDGALTAVPRALIDGVAGLQAEMDQVIAGMGD